MIAIDKGAAPKVLQNGAAAAAQTLKDQYDANSQTAGTKDNKFKFSSSLYGHQDVRDALNKAQHGKCAFCEVIIPKPYADANVEHWRPKGSVKQETGSKVLIPGYYWLAYDWDNLLFACLFCNRDNKGVQFPLRDPASRTRNHHGVLANEEPLLLKPDDGTDLTQHIIFRDELPVGISEEGKATIKVLGLDRLEHNRRDQLFQSLLEAHAQVVKHNGDPHAAAQTLVAQGRALYAAAVLPQAEFSAMAAAFVAANPLPAPV
jgi:uncharacterized protein (TIGR02646 family)